jgi:hypothetical protein
VLGRNFRTFCYISELEGSSNSRIHGFHHWLKALDATPYNYPGAVGCGPNESPDGNDTYYWSAAVPGEPIEARYTDNDSWSTNEVAINWQAAAVYNIFAARAIARGQAVDWPGSGDNVPFRYSLLQNYPNPFNPTTTIIYDVPVDTYATLRLFNVLGQEVLTFVDGFVKAGSRAVIVDASNLSSGVYFYRLQTDIYVDTKRMVVIK